ncbi:MAG: hypothetical protein BEN19_01905 [Epulopiscium sp. Nuni2H_MBin003]|nr:MAG: hypothetical protein BEN19_01905 [Epulopiscium sp. Nuni2H_MBin003]
MLNNLYLVVFDAIFLIIAILIVYMYKRENETWEITGVKDVYRGTILGILFSSIMSVGGINIKLTFGMLLLIPLTLLMTSVNPKWGCYSYVIPFTYFLGEVLETFGYNITWFNLPYNQFIVLIGFLHLIEGILVMRYGSENTKEVPIFNGKNITKGYMMKKFWPIPLIIFSTDAMPIYAILGYMDIGYDPQNKTGQMGKIILVYGLFIILLGILTQKQLMPLNLALLIMPIGHELMFLVNYIPFRKKVKL